MAGLNKAREKKSSFERLRKGSLNRKQRRGLSRQIAAGKADVLCTLDRHFASAVVREYARAQGFELMNHVELLRRLRSGNAGIQ
jgi:hypothetical protein